MKKRIALAGLGLLLSFSVFAQNGAKWKIGVRAGWNYSDQLIVNPPQSFSSIAETINRETDWLAGVTFGIQNEFQLNKFLSFNLDVLFNERGYRTSSIDTTSQLRKRVGSVARYISLPLGLNAKLSSKLRLEAGAEASILVGQNFIEDKRRISIPNEIKNESLDFGVYGGIVYEWTDKIRLVGRYFRGLKDIQNIYFTDENGNVYGDNTKIINHGVQASVIVFPF